MLRNALVPNPNLYIGDITGRPLDYGRVYFGEPNKDPEFYPVDVFLDEKLTIQASQPVRTKGGFLYANGDIVEIYANTASYSVKILDTFGRKIFYKAEITRLNLAGEITTALGFSGAVSRTQADKNADFVSVADFGAVGDEIADDTQALQNAIDAGVKLQFDTNARYKITRPLILKHGTSNGITYNNLIDFNYCQIIPYFADYAIKIQSMGTVKEPTTNLAYFDLKNLTINLGANAKAKALKIGGSNQFIDSFHYSTITNFLIEDSSNTHGIVTHIENARHLRFVGMAHRGCGVQILCRDDNAFCGDIEFLTCEFAGNSKNKPLVLTAGRDSSQTITSSVRGVTFDNCDIYGSGTLLEAVGKGDLGDIWFDKVQFDAPPLALPDDSALNIQATDNARLFQLHYTNCYFVGYPGMAIGAGLSANATSTQIDFSNCHFGHITNRNINKGNAAIYVMNFANVAFNNCEFADINTSGLFNFDRVSNFKVLGNKAVRCQLVEFLAYVGGNSKNYIIANNISDTWSNQLINDYSSSEPSQKIVKDNLKT